MATKNLSTKAKYVPNRMINEIEVERNGKTTTIDGADLLDGAYVKKSVKFGNGGGVAVSSESGLAVGTNADLMMNQNNLQYRKGGGIKSKSNYISNRMINEMEVERNGKTTTIDGADLLDGAYVKKGVKYAKGSTVEGFTNEDLEEIVGDFSIEQYNNFCYNYDIDVENGQEMSNFIYGLNKNELNHIKKEIDANKYGIGGFLAGVGVGAVAKHYYDKNKGAKGKKKKFNNGGGVAVSSESGLAFGTNAELLMNEQNLRYEDGGRMGTWCYEIGGL